MNSVQSPGPLGRCFFFLGLGEDAPFRWGRWEDGAAETRPCSVGGIRVCGRGGPFVPSPPLSRSWKGPRVPGSGWLPRREGTRRRNAHPSPAAARVGVPEAPAPGADGAACPMARGLGAARSPASLSLGSCAAAPPGRSLRFSLPPGLRGKCRRACGWRRDGAGLGGRGCRAPEAAASSPGAAAPSPRVAGRGGGAGAAGPGPALRSGSGGRGDARSPGTVRVPRRGCPGSRHGSPALQDPWINASFLKSPGRFV